MDHSMLAVAEDLLASDSCEGAYMSKDHVRRLIEEVRASERRTCFAGLRFAPPGMTAEKLEKIAMADSAGGNFATREMRDDLRAWAGHLRAQDAAGEHTRLCEEMGGD